MTFIINKSTDVPNIINNVNQPAGTAGDLQINAGNGRFGAVESSAVTAETPSATHTILITINGVSYKLLAAVV